MAPVVTVSIASSLSHRIVVDVDSIHMAALKSLGEHERYQPRPRADIEDGHRRAVFSQAFASPRSQQDTIRPDLHAAAVVTDGESLEVEIRIWHISDGITAVLWGVL